MLPAMPADVFFSRLRLMILLLVALNPAALAANQHVALLGREKFRITYDSSFTWPNGDGSATPKTKSAMQPYCAGVSPA